MEGPMWQKIDCKKEQYKENFQQLYAEAEKVASDVNHIVRVNGSSAFPMPKPNKGLMARVVDRFKS